MKLELSPTFTKNIISAFRETGENWLKELPEHLSYLSEAWNFQLIHPMPDLSYGYVALVQLNEGHESKPAILKTTPSGSNLILEAYWLKSFTRGVADVYHIDEERHAILMEYLEPGISLKKLVQQNRDEEATGIICQKILELQSSYSQTSSSSSISAIATATSMASSTTSASSGLIAASSTTSDFSRYKHISELFEAALPFLKGHMDDAVISKAKTLYQELSFNHQSDILLHGDLHHDNILQCGSDWKVIDPHGYIGDPAAEVGTMIRNPYDFFPNNKPLKSVLERRLKILNEMLPFDPKRMNAWCFCFTVLSAAWDVEGFNEITSNTGKVALALNAFV